jgi:hypothetical protein
MSFLCAGSRASVGKSVTSLERMLLLGLPCVRNLPSCLHPDQLVAQAACGAPAPPYICQGSSLPQTRP